ncbi:MAG: starch-binding protein [Ruminococcus sp.]|nr:starch-binding protein [Ruminococcus sp.]
MVRRKHRLMSLVLCVLMVLSLATVASVASVNAASGDTVYCQNDANWGEVYCYMWSDSLGDNGAWPGQKMTQGSDGLWSYSVSSDWNMIIFNNGSGTQTGDLNYQGNGSCYNNSNGSWTTVDTPNPTPTTPDPTPTPTTPDPTPTPTPSDKYVVYCKDEAGWGNVSVYMWTDGQGDNKSWPGVAATNIGDGVWMLEYDKDYANIIFNNGGSTQTGDMTHPGSGQMYNNKTGQWSLYDPSQLHIKSFTADPASPQYTGVDIKLTVVAGGGEGELLYKFSAGNTVISDYSANNTAVWTPTTAGSYTITYEVKDEAGNTKTQTASFTIKDITTEVKPVVQTVAVTPTNFENTEIQKGKEATVDITAGGGNTGTKLLFYKVKITDPNGKTANVPYYTTKDAYKFTPTTLGTYTIEVSVQGSDNSTVVRMYEYECVDELSAPGALTASLKTSGSVEVGSTITATATASGGVAPYTYQFKLNDQIVKAYSSASSYSFELAEAGTYTVEVTVKDSDGATVTKTASVTVNDAVQPSNPDNPTDPVIPVNLKGDADCDGEVNIKDATAIQKFIASIEDLSSQGEANAEVDYDDDITIKDATMIQKHIAGIDVNW